MNHNLATALLELEKAAGRVGQLMEGITPEEADRIAEVFGPAPKTFRLARWRAFWIAWLHDCAALHPCATSSIPPESGCDLDVSCGLIDNPSLR